MRRTTALLAWGALSSSANAWVKNPWQRRSAEESWTPALETTVPNPDGDQNQLELGWSPRPTEAPELYARYGGMVFERQDENTLGSDTCGFNAGGNSYTCVTGGATCTYSNDYIGCCDPSSACNVVRTTCIDYDASVAGDCNILDDFHTICCGTSAFGACFTWVLSTSSSTYTLLDCSAQSGTSTLFAYDPALGVPTTTSSETTSEEVTSTTASETTAATTTEPPKPKSKTNVGAIAGGVVGGVAVLALVAVGVFFLLRKKRNDGQQPAAVQAQNAPPNQPQPQMGQTPQSPQSFAPTSPGGATYPSGAPPGFQGYSQQGTPQPYDPRMSTYTQQTPFTPQSGFNAVSPQQQFQPQYAPQGFEQQQGYQQQGQYPSQYGAVAGYQPPSTGSPPPNLTPSPGPKESEAVSGQMNQQPPQHQHQQSQSHNAQELPAVNPLGMESNRAELG